ncbi:MAG: ATP synthase F1 subunit gamma [Planctomycetaceae bacterium]|jgi:F-type H+-transporting ATPase subunit gamma
MAKARAVLKRLKAVKNIRKITRTMELIATARFKKAMDRATQASAYTNKIAELASDLASSATDFVHPLLEGRTEQKNGILLILTSNRGLCGGFNAGVLKVAMQRIRDAKAAGQNLRIEVSGKRGINFLKFQKVDYGQSFTGFEDKPRFDEVDQIASRYIAQYTSRSIDFVDVAYVRFVSAARQIATLDSLLPLAKPQVKDGTAEAAVDYEFLPNPREILEEILPAAFKARLFKCFLDGAVSEQIFRMVAMKGATENAGEMISSLSRQYNRARQAQITSELSEIIGGAEAIK